jgi:hypothetical protein
MNINRAALSMVVFVCSLLAMPCNLPAQQTAPRVLGPAPSASLARNSRPVFLRPAPISRPAAVALRRAPSNGIRLRTSTNPSRTDAGASTIGTPHPEDEFGFTGAAPLSLEELLNISPNSGFDWESVNALNQDLAQKALIDPVTQLEIAQAERLLRSGAGAFSGAYILGGGYGYYVPEEAAEEQPSYPSEEQGQAVAQEPAQNTQPQIILLQQAAPREPGAEGAAQQPPEQTVSDQGEFTLVLRNGKHIKALAFTHVKDTIVYITPDGARETIDAGDLDADATVRLNQERGTPLQLPL